MDAQSGTIGIPTEVWRLAKLEASGFGGLTVFGGPVFTLETNRENWCLEGQNGSGKTSLTNSILWALTGKRLREQDGLIDDVGHRAPVYNDTGNEIGQWPPLISYPEGASDLGKEAKVWVRLTFTNDAGDVAVAYRETTSTVKSGPQTTAQIDARLLIVPELIETGLLMPARIPGIGFGGKSQSLYEAVKLLTGLDQLADIAESARLVTHGAQPFLKYAKQNGVEQEEKKFKDNIGKAQEKAAIAGFDLSQLRALGQADLAVSLKAVSQDVSTKASELIATLKTEIADGLDTTSASVREKIRMAAASARAVLTQGAKGVSEFDAWAALKLAHDNDDFRGLPDLIAGVRSELDTAIGWHSRQMSDDKLRLKALAAQYYVVPEDGQMGICPLCREQLKPEQQAALGAELAELKAHSDAAERQIADVCAALEKRLAAILTPELRKHQDILALMEPRATYESAVLARFAEEEPFNTILTGIARFTKETVSEQIIKLPAFDFKEVKSDGGDTPPVVKDLLAAVHRYERLKALVDWWFEHGQLFVDAWTTLVQARDSEQKFHARTVGGQIDKLLQAIEKAEPLDELAKYLLSAIEASDSWDKIQKQQALRKSIADALEPLKDLRLLVGAETASSISGLSVRIKEILARIHLRERLDYADTSLQKKAVHVEGSFDPGMRIDAALVANTSWLRAILWAFVLALREQTIDGLPLNPFPLAVMDDPQGTFDPRNKRKWAELLAAKANMPVSDKQGMQLILTTHEQQFFKFIVNEQKLSGQQGMIAPVNKVNRVATVANGSSLVRAFDAAVAANDDALGHKYVSDVRIYCEDLLKCIMRAEGPGIANMNLDSLKKEIKKLGDSHIRPFDRAPFIDLSSLLSGGGGLPMKLINDSHHQFDGTIGVAQAHDVKAFWENNLQSKLHQVFQVYAQFEAFSGDPRMFMWDETVVAFPPSLSNEIKTITLLDTGVAAAAKSDGRAGDGAITLTEWDAAKPITLPNHEIFQLTSGTLDPVATIGDMLIVSNYATVTKHSLVVAAFGQQMLARRYNESDMHPDVAVLTGQTLEPHHLPQPVIAPKEKIVAKKIVGTIFTSRNSALFASSDSAEIASIPGVATAERYLKDARLFEVKGRSAEPIALDGQYLITHETKFGDETLRRLDGSLVVAVDEEGTRYFKRLRVRHPLAILESLNPDGSTSAEVLRLAGSLDFPLLVNLLEVVGVLFEMPGTKNTKKKGS